MHENTEAKDAHQRKETPAKWSNIAAAEATDRQGIHRDNQEEPNDRRRYGY